jgi:hypothetical protein
MAETMKNAIFCYDMPCRVVPVGTDVSEESIASIFMVTGIGER